MVGIFISFWGPAYLQGKVLVSGSVVNLNFWCGCLSKEYYDTDVTMAIFGTPLFVWFVLGWFYRCVVGKGFVWAAAMACTISSHLDVPDTPGTWGDNMHLYWHLFKVTLEIMYLNFYMLITIVVSFREYWIKGGDTDSVEPGFPISLFPGIFRSVVPKLVCQHLYHWCYQVSKNPACLVLGGVFFFYSYRSNLLVLTWSVSTKSRASCSRNSKVRSFPSCKKGGWFKFSMEVRSGTRFWSTNTA